MTINGKAFPRPGYVRILGIPFPGKTARAHAVGCGGDAVLTYTWEVSSNGSSWDDIGKGEFIVIPEEYGFVRVTAADEHHNTETSRPYRVLETVQLGPAARLRCRGMLGEEELAPDAFITRLQLAQMLIPLADSTLKGPLPTDTSSAAAQLAVANSFFSLEDGRFEPERPVTRQEMATVAMEACGVNYRNASSTMPVCLDVGDVSNNYGTNVARALYFGFMELENGRFDPRRLVTVEEGIAILNRVADFAGL